MSDCSHYFLGHMFAEIYNYVVTLSIFDNGKEYISASRAAEIVGYSADYIGQLCRSHKVLGKLVGRTWYVELATLEKHKENRRLGKPKSVIMSMPVVEDSRVFQLLQYSSDNRPGLPELKKKRQSKSIRSKVEFKQHFVVTFALVTILIFGLIAAGSIDARSRITKIREGTSVLILEVSALLNEISGRVVIISNNALNFDYISSFEEISIFALANNSISFLSQRVKPIGAGEQLMAETLQLDDLEVRKLLQMYPLNTNTHYEN